MQALFQSTKREIDLRREDWIENTAKNKRFKEKVSLFKMSQSYYLATYIQ